MSHHSNDYWLKKFNIKSCLVKLNKVQSVEMRMRITATCVEEGATPLKCEVSTVGTNTFRITAKSKDISLGIYAVKVYFFRSLYMCIIYNKIL